NSDFARGIEQFDRKWWNHRRLGRTRRRSVRAALRFARRIRYLRLLRGGHDSAQPASTTVATGLMQLCSPLAGSLGWSLTAPTYVQSRYICPLLNSGTFRPRKMLSATLYAIMSGRPRGP